ncbi:alpha/beta fold hydrolase [Nesterenkonia lutea]|uniref:Acyl-coenzyme A synthetase/AMP-(Fatty) acid ligase/pimeloyl-ACP methyl ester carboxylesterase n=1 Tax=Nesterenkonia lutea TaxID=272919 RepID=A0ABR9JCW7_9MICC|nr:alpha/beta fold hydrolase [Nesterenkonia lutea]MBE1523780.1 acyl-coenzyme A synthetase/AMP-(fatty) acid ligase/pimeloyl-ACP methyl ester carboxylesterase [Nesterenkonia lutea]
MNLTPRFTPIPAAAARLPADHAPGGASAFPGLDPAWSRLVTAKTDDGARTFHVLDTGPALAARGIRPTGTILAVHGNPTWSYLWRSVLAGALERATEGAAWRVIAPDQLDMGFSDRLSHPVPPAADAVSYRRLQTRLGDLDALMDALDVDTSTLVTLGHDWGGVISLGWAVRQRGQVDAAITLNTAVDHPVGESVPAALRAAMAPAVLPATTVSSEGFLRVTLGLTEETLTAEVRDAYRAPYASRRGRGGIGGFVADIPAESSHVSRAALDEISAGLRAWEKPTLLLWGPKDPVFQDRYLADLQERVPHADLHRFEGAGHMLVEDRDIAAPLFTWLDDHFGPGPSRDELRSPEPAGEVLGLHEQLRAMTRSARRDTAAVVDMTAEPSAWSTAEDAANDARALSWDQLSAQVDALAVGLRSTGVRRGDRVSLLVPPGNSLTVVLYACLRIGAVGVVADAGLGVRGMTRAVRSARPDWVLGALPGLGLARSLGWPGQRISLDALSPRRQRALGTVADVETLLARHEGQSPDDQPHPDPADPAAILFTSGSTGPAKGVMYTHARLGALAALLVEQFDIRPGASLIAGFAPFALLGPAIGATSVTPDMSVTRPATLTAQAVADAALAGDATMFFGSPAALRNVVATAEELSALQHRALGEIRLVLSAGAPVHPELLDAVQTIFPAAQIHTPYGMTEGLLLADIERQGVIDAAATGQSGVCVGTAVDGVRFALAPLDALGRPAEELREAGDAVGVLGEIVVSAAHLKAGYDRLWFTDRQSQRDVRDGLIWHRTNDIGHFDAESRLWIEGRLQHVLATAQGPLGPGAVETPVDALPEVARSAAVPVGPAGTQAVVVIVEPAPGRANLRSGRSPLAEASFARRVRTAVPEVSVSAVLVLEELPTDVRHNSKIDRTRLAAWAEQVLAGGRVRAP